MSGYRWGLSISSGPVGVGETTLSATLHGHVPASPGVFLNQEDGLEGPRLKGRSEGGGARVRCGLTLGGPSCLGRSTTCGTVSESSKGLEEGVGPPEDPILTSNRGQREGQD